MATPEDVLNLARSQLGVCEVPLGSNSGTPYHEWYGQNCQGWQWCAIFVTWVIWHIDQALCWGLYTAYSGDYLNVGRMYLREIDLSQIAPGDICIWDRPVGGITDHIGFVESVTPDTFTTIEGNSGDCVKRNEDHPRVQTSSCHYYFVRPAYSQAPQPEEEDMPQPQMFGPGKRMHLPTINVVDGDAWYKVNQSEGKFARGHISFDTIKDAVSFELNNPSKPNSPKKMTIGTKGRGVPNDETVVDVVVEEGAEVLVTFLQVKP